jgi:Holliday junction resolvase RusA-like endonuclease
MSYTLTIELPIYATDSNKILRGNKFAHSATRQKIKSEIYHLVRWQLPPKPLEKFTITVTRYSSRSIDWDNLVASFKSHIDGLVNAGVLAGDSWRYIRQINTNQVISKEKKLIITVEEVES